MGRHKKTTQGVDHLTTLSHITYLFHPLEVQKDICSTYDSFLLKPHNISKVRIKFSPWIFLLFILLTFYQSAM